MGLSVKPFAWCLVLVLLLGAGVADAKADAEEKRGKDVAADRGSGKGGGKPSGEATPPAPAPEPSPVTPPAPSPPAVETPPVPVEPAPLPEPETSPAPVPSVPVQAQGPRDTQEDPAPDLGAGAMASAADPAVLPKEPSDEPSLERADAGLLALLSAAAPQESALPLPPLDTPTRSPLATTVQGAALPSSSGAGLLWALPLAGLLGLGLVLSSGRLLQPRPLHAPAPARVASSPAPAAPRPEPAQAPLSDAPLPVTASFEALDVPAMLRAAKAAVEAFRYGEAIEWFDRVLLVEPKLAVAHYCRGVCLVGLGRDHDAYEAYRNAFELDPQEAAYRLELARVCARIGREGEAMDVLGALLRALPELAQDVSEDPSFAGLRDHPRFLMLTGML